MLSRELNSKEVDSILLSIISFPSFEVDDPDLITRKTIVLKLQGTYGFRQVLRDGWVNVAIQPVYVYLFHEVPEITQKNYLDLST